MGTGTGSPGKWSEQQALPELKKRLDNNLRHLVGFLGCPVQGKELELNDPEGSLPIQHIL